MCAERMKMQDRFPNLESDLKKSEEFYHLINKLIVDNNISHEAACITFAAQCAYTIHKMGMNRHEYLHFMDYFWGELEEMTNANE